MMPKDNLNFIFQLNNKNRSTNVFLLYILSGVMFFGAAFFFVAKSMNILLIVDVVFAIVYFIVFNSLRPSFFELLVTDTALKVSYYSVTSTMRSYQSFEIHLRQLKDFQLVKKMYGLKSELILSVDSKYGIADYPPVSIFLLSKNELAQVVLVLNRIKENNVQK
jgi:hypothetical protein